MNAASGTPTVKKELPVKEETDIDTSIPVPQEEISKYPTVCLCGEDDPQLEEEWALLNFYLSNVFELYPRHPDKAISYRSIQYYAATYVKRFFLTRSILQYNPKLVCASSMLLAIKVGCVSCMRLLGR